MFSLFCKRTGGLFGQRQRSARRNTCEGGHQEGCSANCSHAQSGHAHRQYRRFNTGVRCTAGECSNGTGPTDSMIQYESRACRTTRGGYVMTPRTTCVRLRGAVIGAQQFSSTSRTGSLSRHDISILRTSDRDGEGPAHGREGRTDDVGTALAAVLNAFGVLALVQSCRTSSPGTPDRIH